MDVVFAVLPFADVDRPAIGVSLLQAAIEAQGLEARTIYLNFDLAEQIGLETYSAISHTTAPDALVGEWFFADLLFDVPSEHFYIERVLSRQIGSDLIAKLLAARRHRAAYIEQCVAQIQALKPKIVGFTTTFHQTCGCLALASRLKAMADPPLIAFGGANCEGVMGLQLLRSFNCIDYVCTREGDVAFPTLVARLLKGGDIGDIPGILQQGTSRPLSFPALVESLDDLPLPEYRDYFRRLATSPVKQDLAPSLLLETSRGCWWGARQHCTFCGLNGDTMGFRSKTPDRAYAEFVTLVQQYGLRKVECVDNILDMNLLRELMPRLADSGLNLDIFYEVKANLRYKQVVALRQAGVTTIQPGIESFSDRVLRLMHKGCTGAQNIQLLRWCAELGIAVAWNILAGFPGEDAAEYAAMTSLIPLIAHLPPPSSCSIVRLDRFSPLFTTSEQAGLINVRPNAAYYYVFPLGVRELANLAYFFEFDYADGRDVEVYLGPLRRMVDEWTQSHLEERDRPVLDARFRSFDEAELTDTRKCAAKRTHTLRGIQAELYYRCDTSQTVESLARDLRLDATAIRTALAGLVADRLMHESTGRYLSLAVMRERPSEARDGAGDAGIIRLPLPTTADSAALLHSG